MVAPQFCGTKAFDFKQSGLDALITSGYKWLLCGYGNGFVLLSEKAAHFIYKDEKRLHYLLKGLKGRNTLSLYFEQGHLDTLNFGTLFQSINYLKALGMDNIASNISRLALTVRQAFTDHDLLAPDVRYR